MPTIQLTKDRLVYPNSFSVYPDWQCEYLAPIAVVSNLEIPVLCKLVPPKPRDYPRDVFALFSNRQGDALGLHILRGRGALILLPKFKSNEDSRRNLPASRGAQGLQSENEDPACRCIPFADRTRSPN